MQQSDMALLLARMMLELLLLFSRGLMPKIWAVWMLSTAAAAAAGKEGQVQL